MGITKKWSEQTLVEQSFKTHGKDGQSAEETKNVLQVCVSGMELYRREFIEGKYKGASRLTVPFDFIVLAGNPCPEGQFYELEYTIGPLGTVYRALIQAVNAVTDIPLVVGVLRRKNLLPKDFTPCKAWLREDIDMVWVCHCSKDEDGVAAISGGTKDAREDAEQSIYEYCRHTPNLAWSACLEFYRGDCHEVWTDTEATEKLEKIFVCGSENVDDPAFKDQRDFDIDEMKGHLEMAVDIANQYNLHYVVLMEYDKKNADGKAESAVYLNCDEAYKKATTELLGKLKD